LPLYPELSSQAAEQVAAVIKKTVGSRTKAGAR
jgi:hypothetical protein